MHTHTHPFTHSCETVLQSQTLLALLSFCGSRTLKERSWTSDDPKFGGDKSYKMFRSLEGSESKGSNGRTLAVEPLITIPVVEE